MKYLLENLERIVGEFIDSNVLGEIKDKFIITAIHFNINLNTCTKYDLMRIDHKVKELVNVEKKGLLTNAAIFNYKLFRDIKNNKIPQKDLVKVKLASMNISTSITEYMTYKIDESTLNKYLYENLVELGL